MKTNQKPIATDENLNELIDQRGGKSKAVAALFDGLEATLTYWDMRAKRLVTTPDHKTRERCAATLLAYGVGKPVERREVIVRRAQTLDELRATAKSSPELQRALRRLLDEGRP